MKIKESELKRIIKSTIKESIKDFDIERLYSTLGNGNTLNGQGSAAMAAMSDNKEMQNIARNDKGEGYFNPYSEDGEYRNVVEENEDDYNYPFDDLSTVEDESEVILDSIKELCGEGIQYFYSIRETLEGNEYVTSNPEKFEELLKKVHELCKSIESLLYYGFK